jgi:hypothetical protein
MTALEGYSCSGCGQEMADGVACTIELAGAAQRIRYGDESGDWASDLCHDCGTPHGGLHHPGCDVEECLVCHGQRLMCLMIDSCGNEVEDEVRSRALGESP